MQQMSEQERIDAVASHIKSIIELLGEDSGREGLVKTPVRAAKALWFLTSGYRSDADAIMEQALFEHEGSKMIDCARHRVLLHVRASYTSFLRQGKHCLHTIG